MSTEIHRVTNTPDLASRAAAYGVPYAVVDGTDAIAVYEAMKVALDHARSGQGTYGGGGQGIPLSGPLLR